MAHHSNNTQRPGPCAPNKGRGQTRICVVKSEGQCPRSCLGFRSRRPLLENADALADCQPDARPAPDLSIENLPRLLDRVAGPQHAFNTLIILRPLLNLVEVALICVERVVGLLDSPISSRGTPRHIDRHPTRYTATQFKNWGITKTCWSLVAPPEEAAPAPFPNCNGNTSRKRFPPRSARIFRPPRAAYSGSYRIGASERLHSNLPIPVLALQYPKPVALDGLVFDGDRIVSRCPYAIVAAQFHVLEF
jgi:hypothetical protein